MKMYNTGYLTKKRMRLAGSIAHSRLMIRRGYYPDFFRRLLISQQIQQRDALRQERGLI